MSDFRVPFGPSETEFTEKRSRFIGHLLPVETEEQAREFIAQMKKNTMMHGTTAGVISLAAIRCATVTMASLRVQRDSLC